VPKNDPDAADPLELQALCLPDPGGEAARFLRAELKYVTIRTPQREHLTEESLTSLEEEFGARFVRIHRNTLVGVRHVDTVMRDEDGNSWVRLRDMPQPQAVSRRLVAEVKRRLRIV